MATVTILSLQIIGVLFGLLMLYLTFFHYRKQTYTYKGLTFWFLAWILFIIFVLFPQSLTGVITTLEINRALDFFMIAGLLFFGAVVFYLFIVVKRVEQRMQSLVDAVAKRDAKRVKKKR